MNKDVVGMPEYSFVRLCRKEIGRSYPESEKQAAAIALKVKKENDTVGVQERTNRKDSSSKERSISAQPQAGQEGQVNTAATSSTSDNIVVGAHENMELDKFKLQNKALQRAVARKRVNSVLRLVNKENAEQIVETVVEELLDDKAGKSIQKTI